jgi:hypothetical protein
MKTAPKPPQTSMEQFNDFARRIIAVPKAEVEERARGYVKTRKRKRHRKS